MNFASQCIPFEQPRISCPNCAEYWGYGWTIGELAKFIAKGISKRGKFEKIKCVKCETKFTRKQVYSKLIEEC